MVGFVDYLNRYESHFVFKPHHKTHCVEHMMGSSLRNTLAATIVLLSAAYLAFSDSWPWWQMDSPRFISLFTGLTALLASSIGTATGMLWYPAWLFSFGAACAYTHPDDPEMPMGIALYGIDAVPMLFVGYISNAVKRGRKVPRASRAAEAWPLQSEVTLNFTKSGARSCKSAVDHSTNRA